MSHRKGKKQTAKASTKAGAEPTTRRKRGTAKAAAAERASVADAATTTSETAASAPAKKNNKSAKLSALDAAAKVLAESNQPMNCQEMIDAMATKGYWTSPAGLTPSATLYSAILRELKTKGTNARFVKTARGKFAHAA